MTRVYHHFAQLPVRDTFCATAVPMLAQVASISAGGLDAFAGPGIASLDQPFTDFYRAYDRYRVAWERWQQGQAPRLPIDSAVRLVSTDVAGGGIGMAAR